MSNESPPTPEWHASVPESVLDAAQTSQQYVSAHARAILAIAEKAWNLGFARALGRKEYTPEISENSGLFRYVVVFEVLHNADTDPTGEDLVGLHDLVTEGHCSGQFLETLSEQVTEGSMHRLLELQGTDPTFLLGDEEDV